MKTILIVIIALIIVILGVYLYKATVNPSNTGKETVYCTLDAKLCPDGSYVGRTGPKCEFAQCPGTATGTR
ncbi:hypothetical protein KW799_01140 [Candidatus Parcubacteria bacterium]|nr:hypothetical protein [Candidatus Parcubacteria bacterium]